MSTWRDWPSLAAVAFAFWLAAAVASVFTAEGCGVGSLAKKNPVAPKAIKTITKILFSSSRFSLSIYKSYKVTLYYSTISVEAAVSVCLL
ncbi:hypothetical protein [Megasphaera sp.]|uniref:hypothetical protein n=1 Tax=Megasphaera sp. TaxID=2023260 RepID=UPI0027B9BC92|nr:hypothetical protein [Megasphaera sp.]